MNIIDRHFMGIILITLLSGLSIIPGGCKKSDDPEPDPVYYYPVASIDVSPVSGFAPLPVSIKFSGTDRDNDIIKYKLFIDADSVVKSVPFDTIVNFPAGNHSVYGKVIDARNQSDKTASTSITVDQKVATADLSLSVASGDSPLQTRLKLSGTPGNNPFKSYVIHISGAEPAPGYFFDDRIISRSSPIDTLMTFYAGTYSIRGEIVDVNNSVVKTPDKSIIVEFVDPVMWRGPFPFPKGPVNLFETPGSTPQEIEYNALTTQDARTVMVANRGSTDILGRLYPPLVCNRSSLLFVLNSKNLGKELYENPESNKLIYDGYDGEDYAEIGIYGGTRKFFGTLGIPAGSMEVDDVNHSMNYVITGDDIMDPNSYNFIEAAWPAVRTNVQPGGRNTYLPLNAKSIIGYHTYKYEYNGKAYKANYPVWTGEIVNGKFHVLKINPNFPVFRTRD